MPFSIGKKRSRIDSEIESEYQERMIQTNIKEGRSSNWRHTTVRIGGMGYDKYCAVIEDEFLDVCISGKTLGDLFIKLACLPDFKNCIKPEYLEGFMSGEL